MIRKGIRLLGYLKEMILFVFFLPLGMVVSRVNPKYREVWLVSERGNDARDNGYWFYRYLKEEQPERNSYYVITKDSPDYEKVSRLGGVVFYRSFQHYLMYFSAKYIIGTHVQPSAPDKMMYYHLAKRGIRARGRQVFLQHGIMLNDMSWLDANHLYMDLYICGGRPEFEHVKANYHYPEGVVQYLGLCRFDHLIRSAKKEKMILVMPTWRGAHYPSGEAFYDTDYYKCFQSLLHNRELAKLLKEHGYRLVFYPHVEMQKYLERFTTDCEQITVAGKERCDVQELLMSCSLLITDYSSVFFDVAYLKKPVIYYAFDEEEFHRYHYKPGYFKTRRDGFGPVCSTEEELLAELRRSFDMGFQMEEHYQERTDRFFRLRDSKNCERTYQAICNLR